MPRRRDLLLASQAGAVEENGALVVAFAIVDGSSVLIQRAVGPGAGVEPCCIVIDPGQRTHYGGVIRSEIGRDRLHLELDVAAADALQLAHVVEIVAEPGSGVSFDNLRDDLARVLGD